MKSYRDVLHRAFSREISELKIDSYEPKRVNRWEYVKKQRSIATTGGWFIEDFPMELNILYDCFGFEFNLMSLNNIQLSQKLAELYESWELA